MKTKILENEFQRFAKAARLKTDKSHFVNGYGSKYIIAKPGTIFLKWSDIRIGKRCAIYLNIGRGCVHNLPAT